MRNVLLIFIKNPVLGNVKTRLANSLGAEKALQIYEKLLKKTVDVVAGIKVRKQVWYSSFIDHNDGIDESIFEKYLQKGRDLGERMSNSFEHAFREGAAKTVIIGSDCPDLDQVMIEDAIERLEEYDLVIGPSEDGGYYLLAMKQFQKELFTDIEWSSESVLNTTIKKAERNELSIFKLPVLNDIDNLDDLQRSNYAQWERNSD